ncbi:MAG TPA: rhomboid family intramembrane serine protease [Spirochaetota bacterium]|nr:rhomboid family intramembrane serine protease [Spirochaetota bacterium]HPI88345.1 rhomboid family intramembrane serine protease [Spirochaetota bacterium]HPR46797.1 rhomboid family intramembrane serine protease [Spirochaetota bacterium]
MRGQNINIRFGGPITPVVKNLLIINGVIFLIQQFAQLFMPGFLESVFGLSHEGLVYQFRVWQVFTYMFFHGGFFHIIFNLIALWMFAGELEMLWGSRLFLRYYLISGLGAGIFIACMNALVFQRYGASPVTIGASGAIYGILLAYGVTWPNREVLLYFLFPIKMKYLVLVFGLIEFFGSLSTVQGAGGNISHIGHLGGLVTGIVFLMYKRRQSFTGTPEIVKNNAFMRFFKSFRIKRKQRTIDDRIKAKKIIDELLEKIAREGISSLSSEEKKKLEWARKHYYPQGNDTLH